MSVHVQALGLMLVHFCWQGALVALLAWLGDTWLLRATVRTRYALNLLALLAMAGVAAATFIYEDLRLSTSVGALTALPAHLHAVSLVVDVPSVLPWLDIAWAAGVTGFAWRMVSGLSEIGKLSNGAVAVPTAIADRFSRAVETAGLRRVGLRLHAGIDGPFVVGLFRSIVYLPVSAVSHLSPDQLDAVLAHELEHVRRADYAWNLLQTMMETLFFFHPAVWWLSRKLKAQRELCCDDAAIRTCGDPVVYATALLGLEESRPSRLAMAVAGQGSEADLLGRVRRVLGDTEPNRLSIRPAAHFTLPLALVVTAALTIAMPAARPAIARTAVKHETLAFDDGSKGGLGNDRAATPSSSLPKARIIAKPEAAPDPGINDTRATPQLLDALADRFAKQAAEKRRAASDVRREAVAAREAVEGQVLSPDEQGKLDSLFGRADQLDALAEYKQNQADQLRHALSA